MTPSPKKRKKPKIYDAERSWNYCLWLLSRRAYTVKELRDKLVKKETKPEVIEQTLERLKERKFVNDADFAAMYVRSRQTQKGPIALRRELFRKGVAEEVVGESLSALDEDTQTETAAELLVKNAWRFNKDDPRKNYAKAYAFLARRGFGSDVVKRAIEESAVLELNGDEG